MGNPTDGWRAGTDAWVMNDLAAARSSSVAVLSRTTHITSAQLKTLTTTPVEVVPAPGAGRLLFPLVFIVRAAPSTVGYTEGGGSAFPRVAYGADGGLDNIYNYNGGTGLVPTNDGLAAVGTLYVVSDSPDWAGNVSNLADVGAPIVLYSPSGDLADGDGDIDFTVTYIVID